MNRRSLLVVVLIALAHAALYIVYQQGEWQSDTAWTDQRGYQRLGEVLATTGQFTRYADTDVFVPEVIRTPGYPAFVAAVYVLFGVGNNMAVAVAQAFVFAAICCLVFFIARRAAGDRSGDRRRRDDRALSAAAVLRLADRDRAVDRLRGDRRDPGLPARRATAAACATTWSRARCSPPPRWSVRPSC